MHSRAPRIFINDNLFSHAAQRGIARYVHKITNALVDHFGSNTIICSSEQRDYGGAKHVRPPQFRGARRLNVQGAWASAWALKERASIFFSPYYGNAWTKATQVYTIYDMIHELYPELFSHDSSAVRSFLVEKKRCIERADVLIAISEHTAHDIAACYPFAATKQIVVTPLGVDQFFFDGHDNKAGASGKPYLLYVGHRTFHKNFARLLTAFGHSGIARDFDLRVISPDGTGFTEREMEQIQRYRIQQNVHLETNVDESTLRSSYANAVAFVYPSEYEGFGLPILEAMASGTLVATSNTSSMPEVGGDVALYFEPRNIDSIAACLREITGLSTEQRRRRITAGISRAQTFTWRRCQQQTVKLFEEIGSF